jgi:ParB family chromosome partitioning protein
MTITAKIVPMKNRKYAMVPVDEIVVLNSRNRETNQFEENVRSIDTVGLMKPIVVNGRNHGKKKHYELVCGEGRYLAYKKLGRTHIPAEVIDCDRKTALLYSLVENIARVPPGTMWFAREIKRMKDSGFSLAKVADIVGKPTTYITNYIQLVERGEERLIKGVEQGLFSISFALQVAQSDDTQVQNTLMDAFDSGLINSNNISSVRKVIELRDNRGKSPDKKPTGNHYTMNDLKRDITRVTKEKEGFVRETSTKENRLFTMLMGLKTLSEDKQWQDILKNESMSEEPQLEGNYNVNAQREGSNDR